MGVPPESPTRPSRHSKFQLTTRFRIIVLSCLTFVAFLSLHRASQSFFRQESWQRVDKFPSKLWQSWKVDPTRFEERDNERAMSWTVKNPAHRYEVLTDDNSIPYVEYHYGPQRLNRPDIVHAFKSLNSVATRIIQADLLRYLIMYAEGGFYADIDVEAIRPIDRWVPKRLDEKDIGMIIGVETDEPDFIDHPVLGSKAQSFCQWTFACKPGLPVMMRLIEGILAWLQGMALAQNCEISELSINFDQVLSGSGPSAFTQAILAEMSKSTGKQVTWETFHDLEESKVIGGVLVLPSEAFAAGTGHSDSGNHGGRAALVRHHFHASSWTSHHQRHKHPVYGEVERCNWDPECVKLWDQNTAYFASLPEQEQLKMIMMKDEVSTEEAREKSRLAESAPKFDRFGLKKDPLAENR